MAVVSPYGSEPLPGWRLLLGDRRRTELRGTHHQAPDGLLLLRGPGVRPGEFLQRAELVDLVPTLLYSLGLPVARDLDGSVLTDLILPDRLARQPLTFVPSYELPPSLMEIPGLAPSPPAVGDGPTTAQ